MLASGVMLVSDGAYATLLDRHIPHGMTVDALLDRQPERVLDAHRAYIDAGARRIHSPTLMCCTQRIAVRRDRYRIALELVHAAVDASTPQAASDLSGIMVIGPAGTQPRDYWHDIELLLDLGAGHIACLTVPDVLHARAFVQGWNEVAVRGGSRVHATLSYGRWDALGQNPKQERSHSSAEGINHAWAALCREVRARGLDEQLDIGLNCGWGSEGIAEAVAEVAEAWGQPIRIAPSTGVLPNSDVDAWLAVIAECVDSGQVSSVGGCCGTTPAWISAVATATS
jgi:methionine synthase I (cobalamin-dependent)